MKETTKTGLIVTGVIAAIAGICAFSRVEAAPPRRYCCPYCTEEGITRCFDSIDELNEHILIEHPGRRLVIPIDWD